MMFPDVMVDLETMSTRPNAAIVAIGAVGFNLGSMEIGPMFYQTIDLESCDGMHISPSTVRWWMQQSEGARKALVGGTQSDICIALYDFQRWIENECAPHNTVRIWGNGAAFDPVILESAYQHFDIAVPWKYSNVRCYRTVKSLYTNVEPPPATGTHHVAVDDAVYQAKHLIEIRRALKGKQA